MSKYGCGISSDAVCDMEVSECQSILAKYKVTEEDIESITDMIKEAYYQLSQSYAMSRKFEAFVNDEYGDAVMVKFMKTMTGKEKAGRRLTEAMEAERRNFLAEEGK